MALKDSRPGAGRSVAAVLTLAAVTAMVVDHQGQEDSPFEPARQVLGEVVAPAQEGAAVVARPLHDIPGFFETSKEMRADIARLEAENANLRGQVATTSQIRLRAAEFEGLLAASGQTELALVPARVVAMGPAQAFSRTVTIDAGTRSGIQADMTVLNNEGLVGRVIHTTRSSATVLLIADDASVVGARLGSSSEVGFLRGRGSVDGTTRLDLELVDNSETPGEDDVVVTWGSRSGAPYVSGIPIGTVGSVFSSPREQSKHAVITPFVDFSSLDLVGVVVDADTEGDRPVIRAGEVEGEED